MSAKYYVNPKHQMSTYITTASHKSRFLSNTKTALLLRTNKQASYERQNKHGSIATFSISYEFPNDLDLAEMILNSTEQSKVQTLMTPKNIHPETTRTQTAKIIPASPASLSFLLMNFRRARPNKEPNTPISRYHSSTQRSPESQTTLATRKSPTTAEVLTLNNGTATAQQKMEAFWEGEEEEAIFGGGGGGFLMWVGGGDSGDGLATKCL